MRAFRLPQIGAVLLLLALAQAAPAVGEEDAVERGEYLVRAAGCFSCHTAAGGRTLAGGRALTTPFGTFYTPNITPDPDTGIGRWTDAQFLRALRDGIRPDGANYFPVFPYTSFTGIADSDALAIKAYLISLPAVRQQNRPHDVGFPFSWRFLQTGWKWLFFSRGPFRPAPDRSLSRHCARALRGMPYPAQFPRRHAVRSVAGGDTGRTGRSARSQHHTRSAYRDRQVGEGRPGRAPEDRHDARAEQGQGRDAGGHSGRSQISERRRYRGDCRLSLRPTRDRSRRRAKTLRKSSALQGRT